MSETLKRSFCSGCLIAIAGALYMRMENKLAASMLFAFALFFICLLGLDLYTGKIGWALDKSQPWNWYLLVLAGNLLGTLCMAAILVTADSNLAALSQTAITNKAAAGWLANLAKGFGCGILMFLAVAGFKKSDGLVKYIGIFFAIPVFILSGFEHSIADAAYMAFAGAWTFLPTLAVILAGNSFGSIACWLLMKNLL